MSLEEQEFGAGVWSRSLEQEFGAGVWSLEEQEFGAAEVGFLLKGLFCQFSFDLFALVVDPTNERTMLMTLSHCVVVRKFLVGLSTADGVSVTGGGDGVSADGVSDCG